LKAHGASGSLDEYLESARESHRRLNNRQAVVAIDREGVADPKAAAHHGPTFGSTSALMITGQDERVACPYVWTGRALAAAAITVP
jgi:hypothetical protein